jgi:pimeloyl-ACP methyl ester carboxylesterase
VEQLIPVADGEIWAEDTGGDGPAVVLAHPGDWADSSAWAPVVADAANSIAARIPGCETVLVPKADHMLPLRAPERIAELIADHSE